MQAGPSRFGPQVQDDAALVAVDAREVAAVVPAAGVPSGSSGCGPQARETSPGRRLDLDDVGPESASTIVQNGPRAPASGPPHADRPAEPATVTASNCRHLPVPAMLARATAPVRGCDLAAGSRLWRCRLTTVPPDFGSVAGTDGRASPTMSFTVRSSRTCPRHPARPVHGRRPGEGGEPDRPRPDLQAAHRRAGHRDGRPSWAARGGPTLTPSGSTTNGDTIPAQPRHPPQEGRVAARDPAGDLPAHEPEKTRTTG